jgi:ribulose-5-phosphate 4-epimerase/fuculose-1-phosphate aldolase
VSRHKELREEITRASRRISDSGLVRTTSGKVSARTPKGDVLTTPSGLPYEDLGPEGVVLVTLSVEVLEGSLEPSSEVPMRAGLYSSKPRIAVE